MKDESTAWLHEAMSLCDGLTLEELTTVRAAFPHLVKEALRELQGIMYYTLQPLPADRQEWEGL